MNRSKNHDGLSFRVRMKIIREEQTGDIILTVFLSIYILTSCLSTRIAQLGNLGLKPDDIMLVIINILVLSSYLSQRENDVPPTQIMVGFTLLLTALLTSTLVASLTEKGSSSFSGAFHELARLAKYLFVFIAFWYAGRKEGVRHRLVKAFLISAIVVVAIGFMQAFNLFNINRFTALFYKPEYAERVPIDPALRLLGIQRVPATYFNPNILGLFLLAPLAISFSSAIQSRKTVYCFLSVIYFLGILITQSRTAFICSLLLFPVALITIRIRAIGMTKKRIVYFGLMIITLFFIGLYLINELNLLRITQIGFSEGSVQVRLAVWSKYFTEILNKNILFGLSPLSYPERALDSEYIWFLYYGGIVGLFAYAYFLYAIVRNIPKDLNPLNIGVFTTLFLYLLANVPLTTFYSEKVYALFLIVCGLSISSAVKVNKEIIFGDVGKQGGINSKYYSAHDFLGYGLIRSSTWNNR